MAIDFAGLAIPQNTQPKNALEAQTNNSSTESK